MQTTANKKWTFDAATPKGNYFYVPLSEAANKLLDAAMDEERVGGNPLFLCGPPGSSKTTLLKEIPEFCWR